MGPELPEAITKAGREGGILADYINDWLGPTGDLLMDRGLPGEGVIDLDAIGSLLRDAGYRGLTEVEVFTRDRSRPDMTLLAIALLGHPRPDGWKPVRFWERK